MDFFVYDQKYASLLNKVESYNSMLALNIRNGLNESYSNFNINLSLVEQKLAKDFLYDLSEAFIHDTVEKLKKGASSIAGKAKNTIKKTYEKVSSVEKFTKELLRSSIKTVKDLLKKFCELMSHIGETISQAFQKLCPDLCVSGIANVHLENTKMPADIDMAYAHDEKTVNSANLIFDCIKQKLQSDDVDKIQNALNEQGGYNNALLRYMLYEDGQTGNADETEKRFSDKIAKWFENRPKLKYVFRYKMPNGKISIFKTLIVSLTASLLLFCIQPFLIFIGVSGATAVVLYYVFYALWVSRSALGVMIQRAINIHGTDESYWDKKTVITLIITILFSFGSVALFKLTPLGDWINSWLQTKIDWFGDIAKKLVEQFKDKVDPNLLEKAGIKLNLNAGAIGFAFDNVDHYFNVIKSSLINNGLESDLNKIKDFMSSVYNAKLENENPDAFYDLIKNIGKNYSGEHPATMIDFNSDLSRRLGDVNLSQEDIMSGVVNGWNSSHPDNTITAVNLVNKGIYEESKRNFGTTSMFIFKNKSLSSDDFNNLQEVIRNFLNKHNITIKGNIAIPIGHGFDELADPNNFGLGLLFTPVFNKNFQYYIELHENDEQKSARESKYKIETLSKGNVKIENTVELKDDDKPLIGLLVNNKGYNYSIELKEDENQKAVSYPLYINPKDGSLFFNKDNKIIKLNELKNKLGDNYFNNSKIISKNKQNKIGSDVFLNNFLNYTESRKNVLTNYNQLVSIKTKKSIFLKFKNNQGKKFKKPIFIKKDNEKLIYILSVSIDKTPYIFAIYNPKNGLIIQIDSNLFKNRSEFFITNDSDSVALNLEKPNINLNDTDEESKDLNKILYESAIYNPYTDYLNEEFFLLNPIIKFFKWIAKLFGASDDENKDNRRNRYYNRRHYSNNKNKGQEASVAENPEFISKFQIFKEEAVNLNSLETTYKNKILGFRKSNTLLNSDQRDKKSIDNATVTVLYTKPFKENGEVDTKGNLIPFIVFDGLSLSVTEIYNEEKLNPYKAKIDFPIIKKDTYYIKQMFHRAEIKPVNENVKSVDFLKKKLHTQLSNFFKYDINLYAYREIDVIVKKENNDDIWKAIPIQGSDINTNDVKFGNFTHNEVATVLNDDNNNGIKGYDYYCYLNENKNKEETKQATDQNTQNNNQQTNNTQTTDTNNTQSQASDQTAPQQVPSQQQPVNTGNTSESLRPNNLLRFYNLFS